ncbi:MAG: hypothetical protein JNJ40_04970 [Bacteroidia bacterium]|nr:hypothetical protein [Bacteroidia bacterium]
MQLKFITHIKYRRILFSVNDNFLTTDVKMDADINYCIQVPENINNALNEFYTLLVDLKQPLDTIWENIYYRTRSEISSFLNNQQFEHKILTNPSDKELDEFISLFNDFAKHKNIRKAEIFRLKAFLQNKILSISYIKQNNNFICINFYRLTKQRAANLSSFHLKHLYEKDYSASYFGRAHRVLHWLDIKAFKTMEADYYDFCGWYNGTEDKDLLNINKFKEQFTQTKVKEYSGVIYKNKLLATLKKLK